MRGRGREREREGERERGREGKRKRGRGCGFPGGKVRAISRGVLARGDIARDPARSRQIPWFRVRLRKGAKRRDYARSRVHIINARVSHPG